jgi:hypothetical protein
MGAVRGLAQAAHQHREDVGEMDAVGVGKVAPEPG